MYSKRVTTAVNHIKYKNLHIKICMLLKFRNFAIYLEKLCLRKSLN